MAKLSEQAFLEELKARGELVREYINEDGFIEGVVPEHLREAAGEYLARGGKNLRPSVLLFSCGALGGDEAWALPAAAAVEVTHNWTLVHDDIIDRDGLRRGKPSVHVGLTRRAGADFGLDGEPAGHYGVSMALLGGDLGQCWAVHLLGNLRNNGALPGHVPGRLIERLVGYTVPRILEGEALDVQFAARPISSLYLAEVEDMLDKKTGELYRFCAYAGGLIGSRPDSGTPVEVEALVEFAGSCGTAFQYIDDTLGYVSDDDKLGKSSESDLREGKRTAVVLYGYGRANERQRRFINEYLGRRDAPPERLEELRELLVELGGVAYAQKLAREKCAEGLEYLSRIDEGPYRELLRAWAEFLVSRGF